MGKGEADMPDGYDAASEMDGSSGAPPAGGSPSDAPPLPLPTTGEVTYSDNAPEQPAESGEPDPTQTGYTSPESQAPNILQDLGILPAPVGMAMTAQQLGEGAQRAAAAGSGFEMDVDQMKAVLPKWEDLRDQLQDLANQANQAAVGKPQPAEDDASLTQAKAVLAHAQLYSQNLDQQRAYAEAYVESLQKAIAGVEEQEQSAKDAVATQQAAL